MKEKQETTVNYIFRRFNLMSDKDFKAWMLNNHGWLIEREKSQMIDIGTHCFARGHKGFQPIESDAEPTAEEYYYETYI